MAGQIRTKAIVLHEMAVGDYDKRLILLTKSQGKVTAFVKGARRANSKMLASSQLFAYGDYVLGQGKNSYTVYQSQLIDGFHHLRTDVEDMTYAMYLLEFTDYVAEEEMANHDLMHWLLISLKVIEQQHIPTRLAVRVFELKAMSILGFTPWLNDCVICHREDVTYFSPEAGGAVCNDPDHNLRDLLHLHSGTLHAMRYILSRPMKEIYSFGLESNELLALEQIMTQFVQKNLNRKFKTLEFLKQL